jgi:hypothetical protein
LKLLSLPFRIGARRGKVHVHYSVSKGVKDAGFAAIGNDFTDEMVKGFPLMRASVSFDGRGYDAMFGWIQIISHVHVTASRGN